MPVLRKYRKDSILYFKGDPKREIFLINSGKVLLTQKSISGDSEVSNVLGRGEFFGIRSAIVGMPREETVTCVEDAQILVFTVRDFENLINSNANVGLKILGILSSNLRQIGKEEKAIISQNSFEDPGNELFKMGLYFYNGKKYDQALSVWGRFAKFFPNHPQLQEAEEMVEKAEKAKKTGYHSSVKKRN